MNTHSPWAALLCTSWRESRRHLPCLLACFNHVRLPSLRHAGSGHATSADCPHESNPGDSTATATNASTPVCYRRAVTASSASSQEEEGEHPREMRQFASLTVDAETQRKEAGRARTHPTVFPWYPATTPDCARDSAYAAATSHAARATTSRKPSHRVRTPGGRDRSINR